MVLRESERQLRENGESAERGELCSEVQSGERGAGSPGGSVMAVVVVAVVVVGGDLQIKSDL